MRNGGDDGGGRGRVADSHLTGEQAACAARHETGRDIGSDDERRAGFSGDFTQGLEIDDPGIGRSARNDDLGALSPERSKLCKLLLA